MAPKKKKSLSWKSKIIAIVLVLGLGSYVAYQNMVATPEINYVADGIDAEEAAFLQGSINKDKKGSVGTAPAPVVKVTVKTDKGEVSSTVVLNKKNVDTKEEEEELAKQIKAEVTANGIITNSQGTIIGGGSRQTPDSGNGGLGGAGGSTGGGTCATNGSPVLVGAWVSTGTVYTPKPGEQNDGQGRTCVKCTGGGKNGYEGSMDCRDAVAQGLPFVLPTGGGLNYTGTKEKISSCFADVGGGTYVQVGVGQATKNKGKDGFCSPTGSIVYDTTTLTAEMQSMCTAMGKVASNGKCENPGSSNANNNAYSGDLFDKDRMRCNKSGVDTLGDDSTWYYCGNKGELAKEIKCNAPAGFVVTEKGECRSKAAIAAEKAATDQKALLAKELALMAAQQRYNGLDACNKAILDTSTLECYTISNGGVSGGVYVRSKGSTALIACPAPGDKSIMVDFSGGKDCGSVKGTVVALTKANTKNENGHLIGGELTFNVKECKFGGEPYSTVQSRCFDYTGKIPPSTANPATPASGENKAKLKIGDTCTNTPWGSNNCKTLCPDGEFIPSLGGTRCGKPAKLKVGDTCTNTPWGSNNCKTLCPDSNYSPSVGGTRCGTADEIKEAGYIQIPRTEGTDAVLTTLDPTSPLNKLGNTFSTLAEQIGNLFNIQPTIDATTTVIDEVQNPTPASKPNRVSKPTTPGSLKTNDECFIPADCASGSCSPSLGNVIAFKCNSPSAIVVPNRSEDGKFKEDTPCYSDGQCGSGLHCSKSLFFDRCKPIN